MSTACSAHHAASTGAPDDARLLLERGADPATVDDRFGLTPAGWADFLGRAEFAEVLTP
ncbi:hypothetical protein [Isoptericola sp. NPDC019482]|uniref:hypothetical protein n=1 Tax=Isoptericola sp. NPDC019482 TaxID=3154688 RepID=UPI00347E2C40